MNAEAAGMRLRDPPPGGLARLRVSLTESDRGGAWVERGVVALATALLVAVLPDLLVADESRVATAIAIQLGPSQTSWQPLPSSDAQVRIYVALPIATTSKVRQPTQ